MVWEQLPLSELVTQIRLLEIPDTTQLPIIIGSGVLIFLTETNPEDKPYVTTISAPVHHIHELAAMHFLLLLLTVNNVREY